MQIFNIVKCAYSNSKTRSFEYWVPVLWNSLPLAGHFLRVFEWEGALAKRASHRQNKVGLPIVAVRPRMPSEVRGMHPRKFLKSVVWKRHFPALF